MNTEANKAQPVTIVDYGMGNLHSVKKKFDRMNIEARISSSADEILSAGKIILPGIGHFKKAMNTIRSLGLFEALNEAVLVRKTPILGICLGMQLMAKHSNEGDAPGFGWFDADVVRFNVKDVLTYKVPHTGWNQVINKQACGLVSGIPDNSEFYFVHAYHVKLNNEADALHVTDYEYPFVSAMAREHIMGVQYHPEKSHQAGEQMLRNFATRY